MGVQSTRSDQTQLPCSLYLLLLHSFIKPHDGSMSRFDFTRAATPDAGGRCKRPRRQRRLAPLCSVPLLQHPAVARSVGGLSPLFSPDKRLQVSRAQAYVTGRIRHSKARWRRRRPHLQAPWRAPSGTGGRAAGHRRGGTGECTSRAVGGPLPGCAASCPLPEMHPSRAA